MSAKEIFGICLKRLGLTPDESGEELYKILTQRAPHIINDIYLDLFSISGGEQFDPIESLESDVGLPCKCLPALIYGVCAFLALEANDSAKYNFYLNLYTSARLRFSKTDTKKEIV